MCTDYYINLSLCFRTTRAPSYSSARTSWELESWIRRRRKTKVWLGILISINRFFRSW
jgi:hypothetical protein